MSAKDGGPAFPGKRKGTVTGVASGAGVTPHYDSEFFAGMSLRDWFASQALAGLTAGAAGNDDSMAGLFGVAEKHGVSPHAHVAGAAYEFADAMLTERERAR